MSDVSSQVPQRDTASKPARWSVRRGRVLADTIGQGDFDIIMNYDTVQWEEGDFSGGEGGLSNLDDPHSARAGYSNGSDVSFELPGSAVPRAFLDSSPTGLVHNSRDSLQNGRYQFFVRNGAPPTGGGISGHVYALSAAPANALANALVQICGAAACNTTSTNTLGEYSVTGLTPGDYLVKAFPPSTSTLLPKEIGPLTLPVGSSLGDQDMVLQQIQGPPPGTTVSGNRGSGDIPVIYWRTPVELTTTSCPGGTATYSVTKETGTNLAGGPMSEGPAGTYKATIPAFYPNLGQARVHISIDCPDGSQQTKDFTIYIDPSGLVRTVGGDPIEGATVTLYRSDSSGGPFAVVPDGDALMSPANRTNPDATDADGHFGWDVIAGFYKVRAEKDGCVSPDDPGQAYVETVVLEIPPPVTDLDLRLDCGGPTAPLKGDVNCDGDVNSVDALLLLRFTADLPVAQQSGCPFINGGPIDGALPQSIEAVFGDMNCDGRVDSVDALKILRHAAGLTNSLPPGCRAIGGGGPF